MEKRFPEGIYFNHPRKKAPDYVVGSISIKSVIFLEWLNAEKPNDQGYVNLDILLAKETEKPYMVVNDFKPQPKSTTAEEIPF